MDETIQALGDLLIQAIPTFFIVLLLFFYLKQMFFQPLARVLAERDEATAGARKKAQEALDRASAKAAAYEEQIRAARNEIYHEQEEQRRKWRDDQTAQVAQARKRAEVLVAEAKAQLAEQGVAAKKTLEGDTELLANQIMQTVLQGRAA